MKLTSRSGRHSSRIELQMTSMIDVVFLLLIFFMVTASFAKTERELDPAIRVEKAAATKSRTQLEPAIVEIVGGPGRFAYKLGGREFNSPAELTAVLRQFENKSDGAFVRVPDDAPFDMAAAALQACMDAKFLAVSYVPLSEEN